MARHPSLSRTTHTLEMAQIDELNTRLAQHRAEGRPITAADLGLTGATLLAGRAPGGTVASSAVVTGIGWDGDPDFPYLHARFSAGQDEGSEMAGSNHSPRVDLHSAALKELCRRLRLHQVWGTGAG